MADAITIKALQDASLDAKSLEEVVNGDAVTTVLSRLGESYPTLANALNQIDGQISDANDMLVESVTTLFENGGLPATPFTTKALMTASALVDGDYAQVTDDTANNGLYVKTAGAWVKSAYDPNASTDRKLQKLDSLRINSGKIFPLKNMVKDGNDTGSNSAIDSFLVDAKVENANPDYYYKISYLANGDKSSGIKDGNQIVIEKFTKLGYEDGTGTSFLWSSVNTKQLDPIVLNSGLQRVLVTATGSKSDNRYQETITLTIDTNKMADITGLIHAYANSAVIDPLNVHDKEAPIEIETDSYRINKGQDFPLVKRNRGGVTSKKSLKLSNILVGAEIKNADPNYYYLLTYYANGNLTYGNGYNCQIEKILRQDFSTTPKPSIIWCSYRTTVQDAVVKDGTLKKVKLKSSIVNAAEEITLIFETNEFFQDGAALASLAPEYLSYSYTFSDACVVTGSGDVVIQDSSKYVIYDAATKRVSYRYQSGDSYYQVTWGKNGANNLPNFISISKASALDDIQTATFTEVQQTGTDWLPPVVIKSTELDVVDTGVNFTGGNHTDADGNKTATNVLFKIVADGGFIDMSSDFSSAIDTLEIIIANDIQGNNTLHTNRPIMRQHFRLVLNGEHTAVYCKNVALESMQLFRDYSCQFTTTGYTDSILYVGGKNRDRLPTSAPHNNGAFSESPNGWANIATSAANGNLISYIDLSYGIAATRQITTGNSPQSFSSGKLYLGAWATGSSGGKALNKGDFYEWHGGYVIQSLNNVSPTHEVVFTTDMGVALVVNGHEFSCV